MPENALAGIQIAAARVLVGIDQAKLAARAGIDLQRLKDIEACGWGHIDQEESLDRLRSVLEDLGTIFIEEADGFGAGVRAKFSRNLTRAVGRWEGEGGTPADDDIP